MRSGACVVICTHEMGKLTRWVKNGGEMQDGGKKHRREEERKKWTKDEDDKGRR